MGLFRFLKRAGAVQIGKNEQEAVRSGVAEGKPNASGLVSLISGLGLEIRDPEIRVKGERAVISGKVADPATRQRIVLAMGKVEGISEVEDQIVVEVPAPAARFHTVVSGDTLGSIAKKYYGDALKYALIFNANKPMLKDPNKIYPGQVLRIPPLS
jgi:nucleoid-associated protein YgaU